MAASLSPSSKSSLVISHQEQVVSALRLLLGQLSQNEAAPKPSQDSPVKTSVSAQSHEAVESKITYLITCVEAFVAATSELPPSPQLSAACSRLRESLTQLVQACQNEPLNIADILECITVFKKFLQEVGGLSGEWLCAYCSSKLDFSAPIKRFESSTYHENCFLCVLCQDVVHQDKFLVLNGGPLCMPCSPICETCSEKVVQDHVCVYGRHYHHGCLRCAKCRKEVEFSEKLYTREESLFCVACLNDAMSKWSPRFSHVADFKILDLKSGATRTPTGSERMKRNAPKQDEVFDEPIYATANIPSDSEEDDDENDSYIAPVPLASLEDHTMLSLKKRDLTALRTIVQFDRACACLLQYTISVFKVEFILFWLDVEQYRNFEGCDEDLFSYAKNIIHKYIAHGAEMHVALPHTLQLSLSNATIYNAAMFDDAQRFVHGVVKEEILPLFFKNPLGVKCMRLLVEEIDVMETKENEDTRVKEASVIGFAKCHHEGGKYYSYKIKVTLGDLTSYTISRRYSEFYQFHREVMMFGGLPVPPAFPPKLIFQRSQVKAVAERRLIDLHEYLQKILKHLEVLRLPAARYFFRNDGSAD